MKPDMNPSPPSDDDETVETPNERKRRLKREENRRYRIRYPEKKAAHNRRYYEAHKDRWPLYAMQRRERLAAAT